MLSLFKKKKIEVREEEEEGTYITIEEPEAYPYKKPMYLWHTEIPRYKPKFLPCPGISDKELSKIHKFHAQDISALINANAWSLRNHKYKPSYHMAKIDCYSDVALKKNVWYYKDRFMNTRGPCNLHILKDCWCAGVIDEYTLVWGQGLYDWIPIRNVRTLMPHIRTREVIVMTYLKKKIALQPIIRKLSCLNWKLYGKRTSTFQVDDM